MQDQAREVLRRVEYGLQRHHGLAGLRGLLLFDQDDVAVVDAVLDHGIAPHPEREALPAPEQALRHLDPVRHFHRLDRSARGHQAQERQRHRGPAMLLEAERPLLARPGRAQIALALELLQVLVHRAQRA
jgi:hypothetical protein